MTFKFTCAYQLFSFNTHSKSNIITYSNYNVTQLIKTIKTSLESSCLATRWQNPLKYVYICYIEYYSKVAKWYVYIIVRKYQFMWIYRVRSLSLKYKFSFIIEIFISRYWFFSPRRPERLWGSPNPLPNGYRGWSGRGMKLTTHLQLMSSSR
jgi:hypothetical protein